MTIRRWLLPSSLGKNQELTQFCNRFPKVINFSCVHNKINLTCLVGIFLKTVSSFIHVFHLGKIPWKTFGKGRPSKNKNKNKFIQDKRLKFLPPTSLLHGKSFVFVWLNWNLNMCLCWLVRLVLFYWKRPCFVFWLINHQWWYWWHFYGILKLFMDIFYLS